jgi:di/tricarboxylate transporter
LGEREILTTRFAKGLAIAALIMFLISGVDVATNAAGGGDLLPLSSMVRGMIFGFGAVALSTAAFFVSTNERSILVSILLIVTGTLMAVAGMVSTRGLTLITFPGPIIFLFLGFWIIALGIVKSIITRRSAKTIISK